MPIYEYRCPSCSETFERMRPMSQATEPVPCPRCQTASPRTVSRLARVSHGEGGGEEGGMDDFGGGGFDEPSHGHSHGPMGHTH
jgi:putative FmdB family regulatory protein